MGFDGKCLVGFFCPLPRGLEVSAGSPQQVRGSSVTSIPGAARSVGCAGGKGRWQHPGDGTSEGLKFWDTSVPFSEGRAGSMWEWEK